MRREYHKWYSPSLGHEMELLLFGHSGANLIAFPTSQGRFYEWEDFGLVGALSEHLERGWVRLCCVDSVDGESWYARRLPPQLRAQRNSAYDSYLLREVVPFIHAGSTTPFLITAGPSFGAYHAVNFAFRHPDVVQRVIGMSGHYDIQRFADGDGGGEVYFHNPAAYLANEHDPARLAALRHQDIILAIGRDDPSYPSNEALSGVLWSKGIWHALRVWDGWVHDWPWWRQMIQQYIGGSD